VLHVSLLGYMCSVVVVGWCSVFSTKVAMLPIILNVNYVVSDDKTNQMRILPVRLN
jgi:hypothetical protein